MLLFGNVLNAYLNNHNIILLNIDGCEYCLCRYLFDCILTWVLIKSSVCLSVCLGIGLPSGSAALNAFNVELVTTLLESAFQATIVWG